MEEVATPDAVLGSGEERREGRSYPSLQTNLIIAVWLLGFVLPRGVQGHAEDGAAPQHPASTACGHGLAGAGKSLTPFVAYDVAPTEDVYGIGAC